MLQVLQPELVVRPRGLGPTEPRDQPRHRPEADPPEDPTAEFPRLSRQDHPGRLSGDPGEGRCGPGDRGAVERGPTDETLHPDVRVGCPESQEVLRP